MTEETSTAENQGPTWLYDWWSLTLKTHKLTLDAISHQIEDISLHGHDPFDLARPYSEWISHFSKEPMHLAGAANEYWQKNVRLFYSTWQRLHGINPEPVVEPNADDRRFHDPNWTEILYFDFIKQSYLLFAEFIEECLNSEIPLDDKELDKLRFFIQQWINSIAPTNFILSNPQVIKEALRTNGMSLLNGYKNFVRDWEQSGKQFKVSLSDPEAFELGENIATTPGKVIFQNEYIQLIQYHPSTDHVLKEPLLVVPPWINKYYILDLRPENSFLGWCVDQGHTVFVISWINPDESHAETEFEHYMVDGVYAALDAIEQSTGETHINALGYCIGGTLLAATLAHMAAVDDHRIRTATFLTTLIDFSDPGEISAFIDERQIKKLEARMGQNGYLEGDAMASAFSMLRANDLIWSAFINNYLLGKDAPAFDLLHWNADSTRMPEAMHSYYLRNMYLKNLLCQPGGLELAGESLDIGRVEIPVYFLSTFEDHIAPWRSTYQGAHLFSGPVRFVLGGSGHIAGVINSPQKNKYHYYVNPQELHEEPDIWLNHATQLPGSWWPDWHDWVEGISSEPVQARLPGDHDDFPAIEDAPGSYAKQRNDSA
ncbi:MAG: class I poly(R)-hydroxyalkanoic acid synthase [Arenicellales bacterium]|nr:class I poly(R)-hydroxyalkanoic acid synthase [Arenicellales bacterium]